MGLLFEWDTRKARQNVIKHGVTFREAETVFSDPLSITVSDRLHSIGEKRYITLGLSKESHLLIVVHTDRNNVIRIISARKATKNEKRNYEERK